MCVCVLGVDALVVAASGGAFVLRCCFEQCHLMCLCLSVHGSFCAFLADVAVAAVAAAAAAAAAAVHPSIECWFVSTLELLPVFRSHSATLHFRGRAHGPRLSVPLPLLPLTPVLTLILPSTAGAVSRARGGAVP